MRTMGAPWGVLLAAALGAGCDGASPPPADAAVDGLGAPDTAAPDTTAPDTTAPDTPDGARSDGAVDADAAAEASTADGTADTPDALSCEDGAVPVGGRCVDPMTDARHCGAADRDCTALPGVLTERVRCVAGRCDVANACRPGLGHCSAEPLDGCEADLTTTERCGACGARCAEPTPVCEAPPSPEGARRCGTGCAAGTPDRCAGACVDTRTDAAHCGACGNRCPAPPARGRAACAAGACGVQCDPSHHACGAQCASNNATATCGARCEPCPAPAHAAAACDGLACGFTCDPGYGDCDRNPANGCEADLSTSGTCGACAVACAGATPLCAREGAGARCVSGCSSPTPTRCGARCTDLAADPRACGRCENACPEPTNGRATCGTGVCGFTCDAGFHRCGSACASDASVASCGASCTPCPSVANATTTCAAGTCGFTCDAGFHRCGGACVSDASPSSCGASCTPCPAVASATTTCAAGACGFTCNAGFHRCGGACVSDASVSSCGASCTPCPAVANATATCGAGACGFTCDPGFHRCGSACVSDASVSSCGGSCAPCPAPSNGSAVCAGGACGFRCNAGFHACSGACAANTAVATCGASCAPCPTPAGSVATCDGVSCGYACTAGVGDCDGSAANGCETDLNGTSAHCGRCGNACPAGGACTAGSCPAVPTPGAGTVVATFGYDAQRSGANRTERALTTANVRAGTFGRDTAFGVSLDGELYAQPLYVPQVPTPSGRRDTLFVATQANSVYALDARTGATLWRRATLPAVPLSRMFCGNIAPTTGIVGTPVIDTTAWTLYAVAYTTTDGGDSKRFQLYALDVSNGAVRPGYPVQLSPPAVGASRFSNEVHGERGALLLHGGFLYVPFGGLYGDCGDYHGWVVAVDLAAPSRQYAFATPGFGSGLWAVGGVAADSAGRLFATTGNGNSPGAMGEYVLRLTPTLAGPVFTSSPSNYFTPSDRLDLDNGDVDLGSIAPLVLPDHAGSSTPRLLFQSGKNGVGYLLNRDDLGGQGTGDGTTGEGVYSAALFSGGSYGAAATWSDPSAVTVLVPGRGSRSGCSGSGGVMALRLTLSGSRSRFATAWCSASAGNTASPTVSSNGNAEAIAWVASTSPVLRAYRLSDGVELYASSGGDNPPSVRQWTPVLVADGRVYVTGNNTLTMYRNR
ncbi:MAG: PQQ-binding-like beta-propeller repeat protein [Deltaproteobacteria bacterium]|nr:PQQ-binding-like beta-propeller repeat protein [Deltaproteobacteria bacterium]